MRMIIPSCNSYSCGLQLSESNSKSLILWQLLHRSLYVRDKSHLLKEDKSINFKLFFVQSQFADSAELERPPVEPGTDHCPVFNYHFFYG